MFLRGFIIAIDILLRLIGSDTGVKSMFSGVKDEAEKLDDTIVNVNHRAELLNASFEKARDWGAGIAVAGAAGLVLANNLSDAFVEADRLSGRLESLMRGKGLESGIDQIRELGNEIAGLTGGDDDAIATAIAEAVASGRLTSLKQYGIAIDAVGMAAIEAAGKISDQAKSQEVLNQVLRNGKIAADNLRDGMDEGTAKLGELDVRLGNLQEGFGRGATRIKAAILGGILEPIYSTLEASPALQETAGAFLTIGSGAMSAGGSVLGLIGQIGMAATGLEAMGIKGVASLTAIKTAALSATVGLNAATLGVTGIAIAAAASVGYVAYAIGQHIGWIDREQTYLERLANGWYRLSDWILRTSNVAGAQRENNEKDLQAEIEQMKVKNQKAVDDGKMTREQADKANREGEITLRDTFANEQRRIGDDANYLKNKEAADRLRQQDKALAPLPLPSLGGSVTPTVGPLIPQGTIDPTKAAAAAQKAAAAQAKTDAQLQDRVAKRQADIEIATMNEMYATRIAQLEATKPKGGDASGINRQIDKLRAEQTLREAEIRAKYDDSYAEGSGLEVARIRARGMMDRANITPANVPTAGGGTSLAQVFNSLRGGRGVGGLTPQRAVAPGGAGGGTLWAEEGSRWQDSTGNWWIQFKPIMVPQPRIVSNVNGLRS